MKVKRNDLYILGVLIIVIPLLLYFALGDRFLEKSIEAEVYSIAKAYVTVQNTYHKEFGAFGTKNIGYSIGDRSRVRLYRAEEEIPETLREKMPFDIRPYIHSDDYRFLIVFKDSRYWFFDKKGNVVSTGLL